MSHAPSTFFFPERSEQVGAGKVQPDGGVVSGRQEVEAGLSDRLNDEDAGHG